MAALTGKVAVVTGASRGLGRGTAIGLGEAGAIVYATGRTEHEGDAELPGSLAKTVAEVTAAGGTAIGVRCDHRVDQDVERLFARVAKEQGRLDILVNNALGSPPQGVLWGGHRFWNVPVSLWDDLIDVGLRSHYVAAWHAAPVMIRQGHGLILNVASHACAAGKTEKSRSLMPYSVGKAAAHRMNSDMAVELKAHGVAVISVWPPASRTEGVLAAPEVWGDLSGWLDPVFTGRVLAALAGRDDLLARTGQALVVTDLAQELGVR